MRLNLIKNSFTIIKENFSSHRIQVDISILYFFYCMNLRSLINFMLAKRIIQNDLKQRQH
jgi:hypothetical protein